MGFLTNSGRFGAAGVVTDGLLLHLDAGNATSYPGSGQSFLDLSGNGYDFYRGSGSGSDGADPTFNGSAGGLSSNEYFSLDGGDYFTYDSANETWMEALHKDNAAFTAEIIFRAGAQNGSGAAGLFGTSNASAGQTGTLLRIQNNSSVQFLSMSSGSAALAATTAADFADNTIHHMALSLNEAAGSAFFFRNGGYSQVSGSDTFNPAYSSPSSGAASSTMQLMNYGSAGAPVNGTRLYVVRFYNRALSKAELDQNFNAQRARFGL